MSRVVVNQAATRQAGERTFATLERACQTFLGRTPALAGVIRRDDRVRDAIRRQTLLLSRHPASPAAADVEAVARLLPRNTLSRARYRRGMDPLTTLPAPRRWARGD